MPLSAITSGWILLVAVIIRSTQHVEGQPEEPVRYRLVEGAPNGTRIGNLFSDSGIRRKYSKEVVHQLNFRFVSLPPIPLSIGVTDAVLKTSGLIDREAIASCRQRLACNVSIDVAVQPFAYFRIIKVIVEVLDVNDNPPKFGPSHHSLLTISESASVGSTFLLPSATDPDSPRNGVRRYELHPAYAKKNSHNDIDKFGLRVTPKLDGFLDVRLLLRQKLDRETVDEYQLTLVAFDGGEPSLSDSINVTIRVLDANDNEPVFGRSVYEVRVPENTAPGTRILTVSATDADTTGNGQLTYGLSARGCTSCGNTFVVDNKTGHVYTTDQLDREMHAEYQLIVTAEDAPPGAPEVHTVDVTVHVTVDDINDNAPRIVVNTLAATDTSLVHIRENSEIGIFVAHVTVSDPDAESNGIVNCTLSDADSGGRHDGLDDGGASFKLVRQPLQPAHQRSEADYQLITSGLPLDREVKDEYNVSVVCRDNGLPVGLSSTKYIRVIVDDENDNVPIFGSAIYTATVSESTPPGAAVLRVNAIDRDSSHNALVRYVFRSRDRDSDSFDVDPQSGQITLAQSLDRELKDQFVFYVEAIDNGTPKTLTGSAQVVVKVTDVDDNGPVFTQDKFVFEVAENRPSRAYVGDVTATDIDLPPHNSHSYKFISDFTTNERFEIDPNNGTIWTQVPLDREQHPVHYLKVCAYNRQMAPHNCVTVDVIVYILDVNDNPPTFQYPTLNNHTVQLSHLAKPGHVVATMVANDVDADDNARISFRLIHKDHGGDQIPFQLEPTHGRLVVSDSLLLSDRRDHHGRQFNLEVVAVDHGEPSLTSRPASFVVVVNKSLPLTSETRQPLPNNATKRRSLNVTLIVVVCAGGLLLAACVVLVVVLRRKRKNKYAAATTMKTTTKLATTVSPGGASVASSHQPYHTNGWRRHSQATANSACPGAQESLSGSDVQLQGQGQGTTSDGDGSSLVKNEPRDGEEAEIRENRSTQSDLPTPSVWNKRPVLHCSPASACPAHCTSTLPHTLWPSSHRRQIDNNYTYSPSTILVPHPPPPPHVTMTTSSLYRYGRGDVISRRDVTRADTDGCVGEATSGTIIL